MRNVHLPSHYSLTKVIQALDFEAGMTVKDPFRDDTPVVGASFLCISIDARRGGTNGLRGGHLARRLNLLSRRT
jgi:hypothetical protein